MATRELGRGSRSSWAFRSPSPRAARAARPSGQKQTGPLNVGVVAPFTGDAAELGALSTPPCAAATKLVNDAGGVLGRNVSCALVDDTGDPADAVRTSPGPWPPPATSTWRSALESNTAATTVPLVNSARIPMVSTNGLVAYDKTSDTYFWRTTPSDDQNGAAFVAWAARKGYKRLAVVFQNNIGAQGNDPGVVAAVRKSGRHHDHQHHDPGRRGVLQQRGGPGHRREAAGPDPGRRSADLGHLPLRVPAAQRRLVPPVITSTDSMTPATSPRSRRSMGASYMTHSIYLVG